MQITLNGKITNISKNITISDLLDKFKIDKKMVAIEINLKILPSSKYDSTIINEGDNIEMVEFVGGG